MSIALLPAAAVAQGVQNYSAVSDTRLKNPEARNWLMTRGNYQGWSYSALDRINTANIKKLTPVWTYSTGVDSGHEAPPIVNDGVMFISTPYNQVLALDAKTGDLLWRYQRELPEDFSALHQTNRGVALHGDKVYLAALDAKLVALEAKTGKVVWEKQVEDYRTGYYMTLAPLVVNGKVMVGVSGGEFGVRGFVQAFDAESGAAAWKTYTIPGPGEPGHDSWQGETWKKGGASVWMTGTYDAENNVTYWGTGNGSPWFGDQRPGDNLYTASTIAIDPDSGALKGHFQYHWNDSWDWDEMNAPMVIDYEQNGKSFKGLVKPSRNGYLYWLERKSDEIRYVNATSYVKQDVFESIDPKTGRPTYYEEKKPGTGKYADFCPSLWGGKDWPFEAYNPKTGMIYIPANDNHCGYLEGKVQEYVAGEWWTGVDIPDIGFKVEKVSKNFGELQAWNVNTGARTWTHLYGQKMNWGSILTTGGGLVFNGGTNDRYFRAFDATTGEQLWQFRTNSGIIAPPASYEVDGVQYVAVQSGWGVDPAFQQGLMNDLLGTNTKVPQGGVVWVFALGR
jgi:alcohol dehydrogenase (cytochrome c)